MSRPILDKLREDLYIKDFDCGEDNINNFLKNEGFNQEKDKITKIYIIHIKKRVIAYSAIFCSHYYFQLLDQKKEFRIPGICLGQLGVDLNYQKKGVGKILISHCISLANKIGTYAACRILYCESIDKAVGYYQKNYFKFLKRSGPNRNIRFFDLKI